MIINRLLGDDRQGFEIRVLADGEQMPQVRGPTDVEALADPRLRAGRFLVASQVDQLAFLEARVEVADPRGALVAEIHTH